MEGKEELEIVLRFRDMMGQGLIHSQRRLTTFSRMVGRGMLAVRNGVLALKNALLGLPALLLAVATGGLAVVSRGFVTAAATAEETASKFRTVFGGMADDARISAEAIADVLGGGMFERLVSPSAVAGSGIGGVLNENVGQVESAMRRVAAIDVAGTLGVEVEAVEDAMLRMRAIASAEELAERFGRGLTDIKASFADFGSLLSSTGFDDQPVLDMSAALVELSIDLASFQNVSEERAASALRSGLLGEAEALKSLNIFVTEAKVQQEAYNLSLANAGGELTEQEKMLARLSIIMNSNTLAQGDATRTADSATNSWRRLTSQIGELREEYGQRLIVALSAVVEELGGTETILRAIEQAFNFVTEATILFARGVGNAVGALDGLIVRLGGQEAVLGIVRNAFGLVGEAAEIGFRRALIAGRDFAEGIAIVLTSVKVLAITFQEQSAIMESAWLRLGSEVIGGAATIVRAFGTMGNAIVDTLTIPMRAAIGVFARLLDSTSELVRYASILPGGEVLAGFSGKAEEAADRVRAIGRGIKEIGDDNGFSRAADNLQGISNGLRVMSTRDLAGLRAQVQEITAEFTALRDNMELRAPQRAAELADLESRFLALGVRADSLVPSLDAVRSAFAAYSAAVAEGGEGTETTIALADRLKAALEALQAASAGGVDGANGESGPGEKAVERAESSLDRLKAMTADFGLMLENFAGDSIMNFSSGLSGAFTEFAMRVKTGKEAFNDFARSFIAQTIQMIAQMLILRAISSAFGFADGGVIPNGTSSVTALANGGILDGGSSRFLPVKGYATGGPIVSSPHVALIGEGKMNEAIVPLPDGRSIPVEMRGGNGGGGNTANVTFEISMVDASGVDKLLNERAGTIQDIISNAMGTRRTFRSAMQGNPI